MKKFTYLIIAALAVLAAASPALAEEAMGGAPAASGAHWVGFAKAIGIGIAVFGGALGQSLAAGKAVEGISRNPSAGGNIQTAMIIGLALIESLVLLAWLLIAFFIK